MGLAVADNDAFGRLINTAIGEAELIGSRDDWSVYRWQDPSGVRLVMSTRGNVIVDVLPSLAASPAARLADVRMVNEDVAFADVLDADGEVATRLAAEVEQRRLLPDGPVAGPASIVALGVEVTVHDSAEAFAASDASLLGGVHVGSGPPPHFVENGRPWPPRVAAESFISYGVFDPGEAAEAYARISGSVVSAESRVVAATGQRFVAAHVRCVGFDVDVCLPADNDTAPPAAGAVVAGTVFLVASLPELAPSPET